METVEFCSTGGKVSTFRDRLLDFVVGDLSELTTGSVLVFSPHESVDFIAGNDSTVLTVEEGIHFSPRAFHKDFRSFASRSQW